MMVFMVGMVAFAVDIGWIVLSKTNLQNAADSAALAGAQPLMNGFVQYQLTTSSVTKATVLSTSLATARANAIQYAGYNSAGGVNSLVLKTGDIQFGFTDASGNYTAQPTYTGFPNTIKVLLRLDSTANNPLTLFFAPVLGAKSSSLNASAAATIYTGTINNLNSSTGAGLLPLTYDVNNWANFISTGKDPGGNSLTDTNGIPYLQVYPIQGNNPGNFGQLSLNDSHVGDSTEVGWVNNGAAASDIQALQKANLIPLSKHSASAWDWQGDTGFKQSLVSAINGQAGNDYLLPLFTPYTPSPNYQAANGNGSNTFYNIVQFVGIQIVTGPSNKGVYVQPVANIVPSAVFLTGSIVPAGTTSSLVTTFTTPKLSQ